MPRPAPARRSRQHGALDRHCIRLVDAGSWPDVEDRARVIDDLVAADLARRDRVAGCVVPTEAGRARARRAAARTRGLDEHAYLAQHAALRRGRPQDDPDEAPVLIDDSESPLAWLRRRTDKAGKPLLDAASFAAGERFRADVERAGLRPRVTVCWTAGPRGQGPAGGGPEMVTLLALDARRRVDAALQAVGSDFGSLLLDVCGFLKGLETVEAERGWPARSAKVVLTMALARLASHYGLSEEARGPRVSAGLRHWRADAEATPGAGPPP